MGELPQPEVVAAELRAKRRQIRQTLAGKLPAAERAELEQRLAQIGAEILRYTNHNDPEQTLAALHLERDGVQATIERDWTGYDEQAARFFPLGFTPAAEMIAAAKQRLPAIEEQIHLEQARIDQADGLLAKAA